MGGIDVVRRIIRCWPADRLDVVDDVWRGDSAVAYRVDLATPLSVFSRPADLSALRPAQRAGAQRLRALAHTGRVKRFAKWVRNW